MQLVILYGATVVVFLALDALWLNFVAAPLFRSHLGDALRAVPALGIAAGFYAIYVAGILYFASAAGLDGKSFGKVVLDAAILGFLAYGTYELTNFATLEDWTWTMVASDLSWGTGLTAVSAAAGLWITRLVT